MKKDIDGSSITFDDLEEIAAGAPLTLSLNAKNRVEQCRRYVAAIAHGDKALYGINTGFGYLANRRIDDKQLRRLQENIVKSHASGWGNPLSIRETRLAMALRLNVLAKGMTGVRYELCEALLHLINKGIYPLIPEYGSVGASGDLAPLAHLALPLMGLGKVNYRGEIVSAKKALKSEKLKPLVLQEKEGLGLINGTQVMLAVGGLALVEAFKLLDLCDLTAALSFEGLKAAVDPLDPAIHEARGQLGQMQAAKNMLLHLDGSYLFREDLVRPRVQDPYSLRCAPQVHGASRDTLSYCRTILERELNAATDNPLVFPEEQKVLSGGNFHGQPLALIFDFAAIALSEIANIADRRIELLLNPHISGLPAFLARDEGVESGYMAAQYLSCSLVNEAKLLANPASTDSIPGNVGIEDHVSMGMTSAKKLKQLVRNVRTVLAIEAVLACQAADLQLEKKLGRGTARLYAMIRKKVSMLNGDRIIALDIEKAVAVLENFC